MLTLPARIDPGSAVAISESILRERFDMSVEEFAARYGLALSGSTELDLRASGAPAKWSVLISPAKIASGPDRVRAHPAPPFDTR
jgi:hypothetical protein